MLQRAFNPFDVIIHSCDAWAPKGKEGGPHETTLRIKRITPAAKELINTLKRETGRRDFV